MSVVRNAHFFRKLPAELSEASAVGGAISIVAIVSMLALLVSNTHAYLSSTTTQTRLELDVDTSESLLITFNITMQRLPCRFASVDLFDESGTRQSLPAAAPIPPFRPICHARFSPCIDLPSCWNSTSRRLNISTNVLKLRVDALDGHEIEEEEPELWSEENDDGTFSKAHTLAADSLAAESAGAGAVPIFGNEAEFETHVRGKDLVMVMFGAPWCPFSRMLEPVWQATHERALADGILLGTVELARVDCTRATALCQQQHIHAFPTVRVYRAHNVHAHEEYHGPRTVDELHNFLLEAADEPEVKRSTHLSTSVSTSVITSMITSPITSPITCPITSSITSPIASPITPLIASLVAGDWLASAHPPHAPLRGGLPAQWAAPHLASAGHAADRRSLPLGFPLHRPAEPQRDAPR